MDCSPPGFSVHGISQTRVLEWVANSFSMGSSRPRDQTCISFIGRGILSHWATWEAPIFATSVLVLGTICHSDSCCSLCLELLPDSLPWVVALKSCCLPACSSHHSQDNLLEVSTMDRKLKTKVLIMFWKALHEIAPACFSLHIIPHPRQFSCRCQTSQLPPSSAFHTVLPSPRPFPLLRPPPNEPLIHLGPAFDITVLRKSFHTVLRTLPARISSFFHLSSYHTLSSLLVKSSVPLSRL